MKESIFALSKSVGTVLQDPDGQFIGLTVAEDIAFALENDCVPQKEMHAAVARAAKLVDVDHHLGFAPHELSGGQKQRVSLAGVMVDAVKILLFDEPLANLDPAAGKQTIELIDRIQKETDTTVLIIEHRLEDVLWRSVDRIVLMDEGRIAADLRPDELLCSPLLTEAGIREPLYLTALKYAGVHAGTHRGRQGRGARLVPRGPRRRPRSRAAGAAGGEGPELWLHQGPHHPAKHLLRRAIRRDSEHRGPQRRGQIHPFQTHLRV